MNLEQFIWCLLHKTENDILLQMLCMCGRQQFGRKKEKDIEREKRRKGGRKERGGREEEENLMTNNQIWFLPLTRRCPMG